MNTFLIIVCKSDDLFNSFDKIPNTYHVESDFDTY